jgi:hypothetical protein
MQPWLVRENDFTTLGGTSRYGLGTNRIKNSNSAQLLIIQLKTTEHHNMAHTVNINDTWLCNYKD